MNRRSDTPALPLDEPASSGTTGAATESGVPNTEYVSSEDGDTAGTIGTAETVSSTGAPSGGPSDVDADATPSPS